MLGLGDLQIAAALLSCLGVTLFAVIYGTVNWNRGSNPRREVARIRCRRINRVRAQKKRGE